MVKLPGGFSPVAAIKQVANPWSDQNIFSDISVQGGDRSPVTANQWYGIGADPGYSSIKNSGQVSTSQVKSATDDNRNNNASRNITGGSGDGTGANTAVLQQGLNATIANLQGQLGALTPQEQAARARVLNSYQTQRNSLESGLAKGQRNLTTARNQVNESKTRSLQNLADSIRMQSQGYANQLGAFGAGDSSATGMINFALSQQGSRERGDVLSDASAQLTDIKFREEDLMDSYNSGVKELANWKQASLFDISNQYANARAEIENSILDARAKAAAEQNLTQQAVDALRQLEANYQRQGSELANRFRSALAPQSAKIDPSLQQYEVKPLSPVEINRMRMPTAVNPEDGLTALLKKRDEDVLANPLGV